jgi:hypothetical protein
VHGDVDDTKWSPSARGTDLPGHFSLPRVGYEFILMFVINLIEVFRNIEQ